MHTPVVVAIDGPAGAGKSTVSRLLAERLGVVCVDSGATYRLVGLRALEEGVRLDDAVALGELAARVAKDCEMGPDGHLRFQNAPVGGEIRTAAAGDAASKVAAFPGVRAALVELQRRLVPAAGAVVEGRDIGTVVLPDAALKVYLEADPQTRARRRADELGETAPGMLEAVTERDERDASRAVSPMRPATGALIVDTTRRTPEQIVDQVMAAISGSGEGAPAPASVAPTTVRRTRVTTPLPASTPALRALRLAVYAFAFTILRGGFRLERHSRHRIPPSGAAILAPNHRSLLDIPVVAMLTHRKIWFMGKEELWKSRPLGAFLSALGGFPVRRGRPDRRSLNTALDLLARGEIVVVYPEGTRTPDAHFDKLEDGVAYLALRSGAPVVPIALSGTENVLPPHSKLPRLVRIRTLVGEPVPVGGPIDGVVPRSRVRTGTEMLRARLQAVLAELEPRPAPPESP